MKKTIIIVIAAIFAVMNVNAQEPQKKVELNRETKTFSKVEKKKSTGIPTPYVWEDSKGITYQIFLHQYTKGENKGKWTCFIWRISQNTGKEYKYYLPDGMIIAEQIIAELK